MRNRLISNDCQYFVLLSVSFTAAGFFYVFVGSLSLEQDWWRLLIGACCLIIPVNMNSFSNQSVKLPSFSIRDIGIRLSLPFPCVAFVSPVSVPAHTALHETKQARSALSLASSRSPRRAWAQPMTLTAAPRATTRWWASRPTALTQTWALPNKIARISSSAGCCRPEFAFCIVCINCLARVILFLLFLSVNSKLKLDSETAPLCEAYQDSCQQYVCVA
jgi:hypothetical protein